MKRATSASINLRRRFRREVMYLTLVSGFGDGTGSGGGARPSSFCRQECRRPRSSPRPVTKAERLKVLDGVQRTLCRNLCQESVRVAHAALFFVDHASLQCHEDGIGLVDVPLDVKSFGIDAGGSYKFLLLPSSAPCCQSRSTSERVSSYTSVLRPDGAPPACRFTTGRGG